MTVLNVFACPTPNLATNADPTAAVLTLTLGAADPTYNFLTWTWSGTNPTVWGLGWSNDAINWNFEMTVAGTVRQINDVNRFLFWRVNGDTAAQDVSNYAFDGVTPGAPTLAYDSGTNDLIITPGTGLPTVYFLEWCSGTNFSSAVGSLTTTDVVVPLPNGENQYRVTARRLNLDSPPSNVVDVQF